MATSDDYLKPGELSRRMEIVDDALEQIRMAGVPMELVHQWRRVILDSLRQQRVRFGGVGLRVYLAFYGSGDVARYLKIGVAREPRERMKALDTGSPHKRLWTFQSPVMGNGVARDVERLLLNEMGKQRASGEWVELRHGGQGDVTVVVDGLRQVSGVLFDPI